MILSLTCILFWTACSMKNAEFLTLPVNPTDLVYETNSYIITVGATANHNAVAVYDVDGNLIKQIDYYRQPASLGTPRGIVQMDEDNFLIASDTTDRIDNFLWTGFTPSTFFSGGGLAGNIYDIEKDSSNNLLVIETNTIERFDSAGNQKTPIYIAATVGGCTLSGPRTMAIDANDVLYVSSYTNNRILRYDVSGATSTCLNSTATTASPNGLLIHSNGYVYYNTHGDDQIYRANADMSGATAVFTTNTTILNNPSAMIELPDGTILVASTGTNTVEQFDEDGTYIGNFLRDAQSLTIQDMTIFTRVELVE